MPFRVYRRTKGESQFGVVADGIDPTSYLDTGATPGVLYEYAVTEYNSAGESNLSATAEAQRPVFVDALVAQGEPITDHAPDFDHVGGGWRVDGSDVGNVGTNGLELTSSAAFIDAGKSPSLIEVALARATNLNRNVQLDFRQDYGVYANLYRVRFRDDVTELQVVDGGSLTTLATLGAGAVLRQGAPLRFRLSDKDGVFRFWVDGEEVGSYAHQNKHAGRGHVSLRLNSTVSGYFARDLTIK